MLVRQLPTMLSNQTLERLIKTYNESVAILNKNEEDTSSYLKVSSIRNVESNSNLLYQIYLLTIFLFAWILFIFVYPAIKTSESSGEENIEDMENNSVISNNETDIHMIGEEYIIDSQLQYQNPNDIEKVDFV